jgi:hypothetical protein
MGVAAKAAKVLSTIESAEIAGSDGVDRNLFDDDKRA